MAIAMTEKAMKINNVSNDNIPIDEMALAYLLQSAKSRGLGWCSGAYYRDENGMACNIPVAATCCAFGAKLLDDGCPLDVSMQANDYADYDGLMGYRDNYSDNYSAAVQLGHAFRAAMTED